MDSREVIVVDDTPPSSPVLEKNSANNSQDLDLSSTNETLSWSTFTAKFISSTMNSIVLDSDDSANDSGYNTLNVATYNSERAMLNTDSYLQIETNSLPRQYRSPHKPEIVQYYAKTPYYENYMHSIEVTNRYSYYPSNKNNTVIPADVKQTKMDSFYYFDGPSQTPMKLANFERNMPELEEYPASSNKVLEPEFVDVNAYVNYNSTNVNLPSNVRYTSSSQPSIFATTRQRKTMNSTTPFLNENRTVTITKMINGEPSTNVISSIKKVSNAVAEDSDDSDIIFVGEYKTEVKVPEMVLSNGIKDNNVNKCAIKVERICPEICPREETDQETKKSLPVPRRNPKRKVQCEKKYVQSADELLVTSKNKFRAKKVSTKTNTKNTTSEKNLRRSLRTRLNCGAVYCPPSPITIKHFREWPVEGMHERPEYNPVTNKIEPFDSHIRNIAQQIQPSTKANADSCSSTDVQDNEDTLAQLCHEMLHHVLAYVATVKVMQQQEHEEELLRVTDTRSKLNFLTNLALEKAVSFDERVWNVLKETVQNINEKPTGTDANLTELRELIENSILLYCFTNNVSRSNVSKYIANMNPTDIMQLSNDKFELSP